MNPFKLPIEMSEDEGLARDGEQERKKEDIPAPNAPSPSALAPTGQSETALEPGPTDRPAWKQITDHGWDREALQLWWAGDTYPEIGEKLHKAPKTVRNRLSVLRKIYGTDLIPKHPQRWEHIRKRGAMQD